VAFFRPVKIVWRKILEIFKWKHPNISTMSKEHFPALLKQLLDEIEVKKADNFLVGFKTCGIVPFDPHKVISKLPMTYPERECSSGTQCLLDFLQRSRYGTQHAETMKSRCKKIKLSPGESIMPFPLKGKDNDSETDTSNQENGGRQVNDYEDSTVDSEDLSSLPIFRA
jgi:hypothetical protein